MISTEFNYPSAEAKGYGNGSLGGCLGKHVRTRGCLFLSAYTVTL